MWQERASPIQADSKTLGPANENIEPIRITLKSSRLDECALREDCMRVGQHQGARQVPNARKSRSSSVHFVEKREGN
jgi:hypothetical protein